MRQVPFGPDYRKQKAETDSKHRECFGFLYNPDVFFFLDDKWTGNPVPGVHYIIPMYFIR